MLITQIVIRQICTMFLFMGIGFLMYRKDLITKEGSKSLAHLLLYCILPCVVLKSFCVERTPEKVAELGVSFGMAVVILFLSMIVTAIVFRKNPISQFGAAFSNAGFMGFPLITATLGSEAVFYAAGFVALLNALQWTYGQYILSGGKKKITFGGVVKNPLVVSLTLGILIFLFQIPIPGLVSGVMNSVAGMNSPVAMIVLGVYLAQTDLRSIFCDKSAYVASAVRLLVIPVLTVAVCMLVPKQYQTISMALVLANAAPIGSNVAVYAQKLDLDYTYAVKTVCLSTILSVITMPLITMIMQ